MPRPNFQYDPNTEKVALGWLRLSEEDAVWTLALLLDELNAGLRAAKWDGELSDQCYCLTRALGVLRTERKRHARL